VGVAAGLARGVGEADLVAVGLGLGAAVAVSVRVTVGVAAAVGVRVGTSVAVGLGVEAGDGVANGAGVAVGVTVAVSTAGVLRGAPPSGVEVASVEPTIDGREQPARMKAASIIRISRFPIALRSVCISFDRQSPAFTFYLNN
jgi:hypothetical protein